MEKYKLGHAWLLIKVEIGEDHPDEVDFITEKGLLLKQKVLSEFSGAFGSIAIGRDFNYHSIPNLAILVLVVPHFLKKQW